MNNLMERNFSRRGRYWALASALLAEVCLARSASAQAAFAADSAVTRAQQAYTAALGTQSVLYDGAEYVDYTSPGTRGHQFFGGPEVQVGNVTYRGGTFLQVPLRYDIVRDQPVLLYPGQAAALMLVPAKVANFSLGSHRFVRVVRDSTVASDLPTGFYELLADGPVRLLARHQKRVAQTIISQNLALEYRQTDAVYLRTATTTAEVSDLKELVALLPDHQAEVQHYAKQQRLSFAPANRAASAEQALTYYYSLRP